MPTSNILREFLVAVGFDVDQPSYRDFESKFKLTTERFEKLAKIATATGVAVAATLIKTASEMERLYFASERTGSSIQKLMGLRFAGQQAGIEDLTSSVEGMAAAIRANPGLNTFFAQLGIKPVTDNTQNLLNLVTKLKALGPPGTFGYAVAQQIASQFGLDPQTLFMLEKNLPDLLASKARFDQMAQRAGVNMQSIGEQSHKFMMDLRTLMAGIEILAAGFEGKLLPFAEGLVHLLQKGVDFMLEMQNETKGWSSVVAGVATIFAGIVGSLSVIRSIAAFLGLGGGAAAGAGAGEAAAAGAAGGAGLGAGALAGGLALGDALLLWHDIKQGRKLYESYRESGTFTNIGNSVSAFISKFEGFSRTAYRDAGHMSIGYGHQIRPGESFAGGITQSRAMQLLTQDTARARAAVLSMVHANLNANQLAALTDLVYNIGGTRFGSSTLLRDLNAGNFSGASEQFARFDMVKSGAGYKESADLARRRGADRDLFNQPVTMTQKTDIHIAGSADPSESARQVTRAQKDVNGTMLRNLQGAVQ